MCSLGLSAPLILYTSPSSVVLINTPSRLFLSLVLVPPEEEMAAGKKRALDEAIGTPKAKKSKTEGLPKKPKDKAEGAAQPSSSLVLDEIDFPRGGGTTLTPLEVKTLRTEAAKEADSELFAVCHTFLAQCSY